MVRDRQEARNNKNLFDVWLLTSAGAKTMIAGQDVLSVLKLIPDRIEEVINAREGHTKY